MQERDSLSTAETSVDLDGSMELSFFPLWRKERERGLMEGVHPPVEELLHYRAMAKCFFDISDLGKIPGSPWPSRTAIMFWVAWFSKCCERTKRWKAGSLHSPHLPSGHCYIMKLLYTDRWSIKPNTIIPWFARMAVQAFKAGFFPSPVERSWGYPIQFLSGLTLLSPWNQMRSCIQGGINMMSVTPYKWKQ